MDQHMEELWISSFHLFSVIYSTKDKSVVGFFIGPVDHYHFCCCASFCVNVVEKQQFVEISRVRCCLVFLSFGSSGAWGMALSANVVIVGDRFSVCQHSTLPLTDLFCGVLVFVSLHTLQSPEAFMLIQHLGRLKTSLFYGSFLCVIFGNLPGILILSLVIVVVITCFLLQCFLIVSVNSPVLFKGVGGPWLIQYSWTGLQCLGVRCCHSVQIWDNWNFLIASHCNMSLHIVIAHVITHSLPFKTQFFVWYVCASDTHRSSVSTVNGNNRK